jgi:hypothetical protein
VDVVEALEHAGFIKPPAHDRGFLGRGDEERKLRHLKLRELAGGVAGQDPGHVDHAVAHEVVLLERAGAERTAPEGHHLDRVAKFLLHGFHPGDHHVLNADRPFGREGGDADRGLRAGGACQCQARKGRGEGEGGSARECRHVGSPCDRAA